MDKWYKTHFTVHEEFSEGGIVFLHEDSQVSSIDFPLNLSIAKDKAKMGLEVYLLPVLSEKDIRRQTILFDAKPFKNPDLRIGNELYEVEFPTNPNNLNNLKHRISAGARQANNVIINLQKPIHLNQIRRAAKAKFIDHSELKTIEFKYKELYSILKRSDFQYKIKEPLI